MAPDLQSDRWHRLGARAHLWLVLALVLGLIRFWDLGRWSFWYDEALTVTDALQGAPGAMHAWGYQAIAWASNLWGQPFTEVSMRWLPALAGYLVIPAAFWAFVPIAGSGRAGLVSLLLAASSWQQYWSQNARGYTMAELCTLIGVGCFWRGWLRGSGPWTLVGFGLVGVSAKFHPHGAVLAFAMALALVAYLVPFRRWREHKAPLVWLASGGAAVALWQIPSLIGAFQTYLRGGATGGLGSVANLVRSTAFFLTPTVAVAALLGGLWVLRKRDRAGIFALITVVGTLGGVALLATRGMVSAQYVFSLHPWFALLAVWPLGFEVSSGSWRQGLIALLVLPCLAQVGLYFTVRQGERPRWKEAYAYAWNHRQENDLLLGMQAGLGDLYLDPGFTDVRHARTVGWTDRMNPHNARRAMESQRPTWLVIRPAFLELWPSSDRHRFESFLARECLLQARFPLDLEGRDLDLEVYYRPGR
ncbi:MAG: hypothetical protein H6830_03750 [Planctomycetes bacterium]|nr:hypothetical protein [Planctomycetota bacterium]